MRLRYLALETDVLSIETASQPGVLGKIAERLAEAEVNIEYTYLAAGREADKGLIILRTSDVKKARRILEDLSEIVGPVWSLMNESRLSCRPA